MKNTDIKSVTLNEAKTALYSFHGKNPHDFLRQDIDKEGNTVFRDLKNSYVLGTWHPKEKILSIPAHWGRVASRPVKVKAKKPTYSQVLGQLNILHNNLDRISDLANGSTDKTLSSTMDDIRSLALEELADTEQMILDAQIKTSKK